MRAALATGAALSLAATAAMSAPPCAGAAPAPAPDADPTPDHRAETLRWRAERERRLRADDGWLTVIGLSWLREGDSAVGSAAEAAVRLPAAAPAIAGVLRVAGEAVRFTASPARDATAPVTTADGTPVTAIDLRPDVPGPATVLAVGDVRFFVIRRGGRLAVRVRDLRAPARAAFAGLRHFPIRERFRIAARLVPHAAPTTVRVPTVLDTAEELPSPGRLEFVLDGKRLTLTPVHESPDDPRLFVIFRDATTGRETYGAGRYLYADPPKDGAVVLDFNRAYNPPCALTPYATCPLPPRENVLPVRIEAGELAPGR